MQDCETFIRGTLRFQGFSYIMSAFNDIGLTSEEVIPSSVKTIRDLAEAALVGAEAGYAPKQTVKAINRVVVGASAD